MKEATASELPAAPHTDRLLSLFDDKLHGALVLYLYASILSAGRLLSGKLDCLLQGFPLSFVRLGCLVTGTLASSGVAEIS